MTTALPFPPEPRQAITALEASRIREIANGAMGRTDVAAFWFGESDLPTPAFIREAAAAALTAGDTFYTQNLGMPALRSAIADYLGNLHGTTIPADRIAVVGSGVSGLMLSAQMVVSPGDRVVMVTPVWPNVTELPRILGAEVVRVPLTVGNKGWALDIDRLLTALTPETRAIFLNSPNNPTGWTIDPEAQRTVFDHCRRLGIWVITDDVYERLVFTGERTAPSLLPVADPMDRLISVNSFSKAWSMTGWRIGWIVAPSPFTAELAKVIEYNTSCVPAFVQQGAIAALTDPRGEDAVTALRSRLAEARQVLASGLSRLPGLELPHAAGAMYAFFRLNGIDDDMGLARDLLAQAGLGLAPGRAFGPEGNGWLRWCFAAAPERIADGLGRLERYLKTRAGK